MERWSFTLGIIEAIAWPGSVIFCVWMFRNELRALLLNLSKLRMGPVEALFERELRDITAATPTSPSALLEDSDSERHKEFIKLAKREPHSAIERAWQEIERLMRRAAIQNDHSSPMSDFSSPVRAMAFLLENKKITVSDSLLFYDLRGLHNQIAHLPDFQPREDTALKYINLAARLVARLENIASVGTS